MEREENIVGGRMTRARGRRLSVESDSSSRPGTPVLTAKLQSINEVTDSNTPSKPVRMTRRNSATAVSTPVNTPTKTPAKGRAITKRGATPDILTPNKRTTRRRASSVTEDDPVDGGKAIKTEIQFEALPEEEETATESASIKKEVISPAANKTQPLKRVTRSVSKSPNELNAEPKSADKKTTSTAKRGKGATFQRVLDNLTDVDSDVEVIDRRSDERNNSLKKEQKSNTSESIIEILDDTNHNGETINVVNESTADVSKEEKVVDGERLNKSDTERRKSSASKDSKAEAVEKSDESKTLEATAKDGVAVEAKQKTLQATPKVQLEASVVTQSVQNKNVEDQQSANGASEVATTSMEHHDMSGIECLNDSIKIQASASVQVCENSKNEISAQDGESATVPSVITNNKCDQMEAQTCIAQATNETSCEKMDVDEPNEPTDIVVTADKTASPRNADNEDLDTSASATPLQNKSKYSAAHKSVGFNDSIVEDMPKNSYPKTPALTKTKSYIEIESDDSFISNATRNNTKDAIEEVIPETQELASDEQPGNAVKINRREDNAHATNTPLKNVKELQRIESSTPIANPLVQMKNASHELTPVPRADMAKDASNEVTISSDEKSLRSGKRYSNSPTSSAKKNVSRNVANSPTPTTKAGDGTEGKLETAEESKDEDKNSGAANKSDAPKLDASNQQAWDKGVSKNVTTNGKIDAIPSVAQEQNAKATSIVEEKSADHKQRPSINNEAADSTDESYIMTDEEEEELAEDEVPFKKHAFIDGEAMEADEDYKSGDSMDEDERREMEENEIPVDGESLGSDDTNDDSDHGEEEESAPDDSFIESDSDEGELLEYSDSDEHLEDKAKSGKRKTFKRIVLADESSTDGEEESATKEKQTSVDTAQTDEATAAKVVDVKLLDNLTPNTMKKIIADKDDGEATVENTKSTANVATEVPCAPLAREHPSDDENTSKLSESALKLCYTAEETSEQSGVDDVAAENSRKEIIKKMNQSELFNKTNHELNTEPSETSGEIVEPAEQKTSERIKRKSLNRSKVEALREAQVSSDDEAEEVTEKKKRTSLQKATDVGKDDSADLCRSIKVNRKNVDDILAQLNTVDLSELCKNPAEMRRTVKDAVRKTFSEELSYERIKKDVAAANRKSMYDAPTTSGKFLQKANQESEPEANEIEEQALIEATAETKAPRKSINESLVTLKSSKNRRSSMNQTQPQLAASDSDDEGDDSSSSDDDQMEESLKVHGAKSSDNLTNDSLVTLKSKKSKQKSLNKSVSQGMAIEAHENAQEANALANTNECEQMASDNESAAEAELQEGAGIKSAKQLTKEKAKKLKPTGKSINESLITLKSGKSKQSSMNKSLPQPMATDTDEVDDEVACNEDMSNESNSGADLDLLENVEDMDIPRSYGLSKSMSESLQSQKKTKSVLHKSYTIEIKHSADNLSSTSNAQFNVDVLEEVEYTTASSPAEQQEERNNSPDDEEQHALKKLDHIQSLFNPLSKTKRQSLALPSVAEDQHESLTHKQLKRLKRQSLNVLPSADDFNPSQSLVDTTKLCQANATDSPKVQNAKRKRLSKSFNGMGTLDSTIDEACHLNKKSKIGLTDESDDAADIDQESQNDERQAMQVKSSTPHTKAPEINNNNRILDRCTEIIEAANMAKLQAKENAKKSKVKLKKPKKKKSTNAVSQEAKFSSEEAEPETDSVTRHLVKREHQHEKVAAVKQAVMASAKILNVAKDAPPDANAPLHNTEHLKNKRRLPDDVLEAIASSDVDAVLPPRKKKAKIQQTYSPNSDQENKVVRIQKSSAGIVVESLLTPKRNKKQKPIETINLPTGKMDVLPVTPKKKLVNGFEETLGTPQTIGFKVRQIMQHGQDIPPVLKPQKRKKQIVVTEPQYSLPKPKWTQSGEFIEEHLTEQAAQSYKHHLLAKHKTAGTEIMLANLSKTKRMQKHSSSDDDYMVGVNMNALNFKLNAQRGNVPREPARNLLLKKDRRAAHQKF